MKTDTTGACTPRQPVAGMTRELSSLPLLKGSFSEAEALAGCRRCDIRNRLTPLKLAVRDRRLIRVVIGGMPWYVPIQRGAA